MAHSGGGLARVTYLPGVVPPPDTAVAAELDEFPSAGAVREPAGNADAVEGDGSDADAVADAGAQRSDVDAEAARADAEGDAGAEAARASNVSMYALARRGMSSSEMTRLLLSRDLAPETVEAEVERLERVQLLDDAALAETLVRTLHERKGLGRQALNAEMRKRGIDQVSIEEALSALDGDDELSRATELALKRAPQLRSLDNETARRRLSAFLMRKGYQGSVVSAAVKAALEPARTGPTFR